MKLNHHPRVDSPGAFGGQAPKDIQRFFPASVPSYYQDRSEVLVEWFIRDIRRAVILGGLSDDELRGQEEFKRWINSLQHGVLIWSARRYLSHWGISDEAIKDLSAEQLARFPVRMEGGSGMDSYCSNMHPGNLRHGGYYLLIGQQCQMLYDYGQNQELYDQAAQKLNRYHAEQGTRLANRHMLVGETLLPHYKCPTPWLKAGGPVFRNGEPITVAALIEMAGGDRDINGNVRWFVDSDWIFGDPEPEIDWDEKIYCDFAKLVEGMAPEPVKTIQEAGITLARWKALRDVLPDQATYEMSPTRTEVEALSQRLSLSPETLCGVWVLQHGPARCESK